MKRREPVRQMEFMSSLSEQNAILFCPKPIVYFPTHPSHSSLKIFFFNFKYLFSLLFIFHLKSEKKM